MDPAHNLPALAHASIAGPPSGAMPAQRFSCSTTPHLVNHFQCSQASSGDAENLLTTCFASPHISIDFSGFEESFGGLPTPSGDFDQAIAKLMENKIIYVQQLVNHMGQDISEVGRTFGFHPDDVSRVDIRFLTADAHNHGKSPVVMKFTMHCGTEVQVVYKPRTMEFEHRICNPENGIFKRLNDQLQETHFPVYEVLPRKTDEGEHYGYSKFLEGNTVHIEQPKGKFQTFLDKGNIRKFVSTFGKDEAYDLKKITNSFFMLRTETQLQKDYLLFTALKEMGVVDLHAGNFLLSNNNFPIFNECLVPIDIECFDDPALVNAPDVLFLIEAVANHQKFSLPSTAPLENALQPCLKELAEVKQTTFIRYVPVGTQRFYDLRHHTLERTPGVEDAVGRVIRTVRTNFNVPDERVSVMRQEITASFHEFEIPYFTHIGGELLLNNQHIGTKNLPSPEGSSEEEGEEAYSSYTPPAQAFLAEGPQAWQSANYQPPDEPDEDLETLLERRRNQGGPPIS